MGNSILIIIPRQFNTEEPYYCYSLPLGLGYISSVLKKQGYGVDCINLNHLSGKTEEIMKDRLDKKKYDFVLIGGTALVYNLIKNTLEIIKTHASKPKIILGGLIIITEPETVFNLLNPDFAVIGEGEETIIDLLETIEKNKDLTKVKGIIFKDKEGKLFITEPRKPLEDLDALPRPDFEGFGFSEYLENQYTNVSFFNNFFDYTRPYPILASRGCPFNCTFCYHYSKYRTRSLDNIFKELDEMVKKHKINLIMFYDECISANKPRLFEVCKRIKKLREEISWDLKWVPQLTVHNIDDDVLKAIKESGGVIISYGFESFNSEVLKSMKKPITPEMIENAFFKTINHDIGVQANFIFGDIAETKQTWEQTLNWWKKNSDGQINLGFIQPFPGSEIYKYCLRKGIIKNKAQFIQDGVSTMNYFNMTEKMTDEEYNEMKKQTLDSIGKYRIFAEHTKRKLVGDIYEITVQCPFCKKIITYGNVYMKEKLLYGSNLHCRNCNQRFFVVSPLKRLAHKYYSNLRFLKDYKSKKWHKV